MYKYRLYHVKDFNFLNIFLEVQYSFLVYDAFAGIKIMVSIKISLQARTDIHKTFISSILVRFYSYICN